MPYWGDIFSQLGKNILAVPFFIFPNWEKSTTTRSTSEGGVACVVIVRLFCCFRTQCVALLRRLYPNPRRDVTLWRLRKPHVMRRHIMTSLQESKIIAIRTQIKQIVCILPKLLTRTFAKMGSNKVSNLYNSTLIKRLRI